ncbi:hypothetical protein, partial [Coleofasciculus sp. LEGE 07092]|uniref:hypothetical protein n=1 Tax=Coleofasciculus sp. LEGE 07092 TaxID=2777969 RepID=UPI001D145F30
GVLGRGVTPISFSNGTSGTPPAPRCFGGSKREYVPNSNPFGITPQEFQFIQRLLVSPLPEIQNFIPHPIEKGYS